jgi:hypothetical protein
MALISDGRTNKSDPEGIKIFQNQKPRRLCKGKQHRSFNRGVERFSGRHCQSSARMQALMRHAWQTRLKKPTLRLNGATRCVKR